MHRAFHRPFVAVATLAFCLSFGVARAHETVDYENDVAPILVANCGGGGCHIGEETNGVDLSSYASTMASLGDQYGGPIVVPGDPDASPLVDKVSRDAPEFGDRMPRDAGALSDVEIGILRQWIRDGANEGHVALRGDADGNDERDITDAVFTLTFLFFGGEAPPCLPQADADANGRLQVTDAIFLLDFLFRGGEEPEALTDVEIDSCTEASELSFDNIYEIVFASSCAFSSCHGAENPRAELSLATADAAWAALVGVAPSNLAALEAGLLRVDPGTPDNSFLLRKLIEPGPGEGNRMPANSPTPLSDATLQAVREWIAFGAPRDGTIPGVPAITDEPPPPIDRVPPPPVPENGLQLHLEPFQVASRSEREIFSFLERPFRDHPSANVDVKRIDIHMTDSSHHFILYQWIGSGATPAPGVRPVQSVIDILTSRRLVVGAQQAFFTIAFPEGVGFRFTRDTSFDLNSHYVNLNGQQVLLAEVYVNFFFAEPGELRLPVKQIFDINTSINVPPNTTRTTTLDFPSFAQAAQDPIGNGGSLSREIHVYALSSHMHRHGVRFTGTLLESRRPLDPPGMIYESIGWDDPVYRIFDPPLVLRPGQGIRYAATHTYDDPPSPSSPALRFGATSEDEMAILLGYYTTP